MKKVKNSYTAKVPVEIETGKKKHVEFAWKQNSDFKRGNYKIEIYHNGFKIGEGVRDLEERWNIRLIYLNNH